MNLGLGTAQLGLDYGISNPAGRTSPEEAKEILRVAASIGIKVIDTAPAYGESEEIIGRTITNSSDVLLVTKTSCFKDEPNTSFPESVKDTFLRSLEKLRHSSVYALLAHHAADLLSVEGEAAFVRMLELKEQGLVEKIGVSVYTGEEIDYILSRYKIDVVQLPLNVFDQRLISSGHLEKLKASGIEIHARSPFLQGLLLMDPNALPDYFSGYRSHMRRYHERLRSDNLSPVAAALGFLRSIREIDVVICGVSTSQQLQEIHCAFYASAIPDLSEFGIDDVGVLDPSRWN